MANENPRPKTALVNSDAKQESTPQPISTDVEIGSNHMPTKPTNVTDRRRRTEVVCKEDGSSHADLADRTVKHS
jgi:hypothetical protein